MGATFAGNRPPPLGTGPGEDCKRPRKAIDCLGASMAVVDHARPGSAMTKSAVLTNYRAVTRQIEVKVLPRFLPDRSSPDNGYFFWSYTVTLSNLGRETLQLKTRHWRITDAHGRLQEVRGPGVVGEEPVLAPGGHYEY